MIIPPSSFLLDDRVFMSIGILKVAAVLEHSGFKVEMLDLSGINNYEDTIRDYIRLSNSRVICLTSTTPQIVAATNICQVIRKLNPDVKLILGGPHITLVNASYKKEVSIGLNGRASNELKRLSDIFDVLVAGDGEKSIFMALRNDSPKLIDADNPKSSLFLTNSDLNALPFPARHLVDVDSYHYTIEDRRALSLITQLGCPFKCGFCGGRTSPSFRRTRIRSIKSVLSEVVHLHKKYNVTGFMLYDDELNVNPKMTDLMNAISTAQNDIGVDFRLRGFIKAQMFNDEQAKAMYQGGFRWILCGFESASPIILSNIDKKSTKEDNTRCIKIAKRNGLKIKALMSIGHPGESEETIMQTYKWLLEVKPDDFDVTLITPYPGTPYYDLARQSPDNKHIWIYTCNGDRLYSYDVDYTKDACYYKGDPDDGYQSYVYTDSLSTDELIKLRDFIERDVRNKLEIPFNPSTQALKYEHSMGQSIGGIPPTILRTSNSHFDLCA